MAGGRLWTGSEKEYLTNHYPGTPVKKLAQTLNRTESAVTNQLQNLGLRKNKRFWTPEEEEYLKTHYPTTPACKIAETLNRGVDAVISKANKSGLKGVDYKPPWTDEDTTNLLSLYHEGLSRKEIAQRMGRSVSTVQNRLRGEGLTVLTGHKYILFKAGLLETGK